jgi:ribosomal peptide maturation radical SAM protein 1
MKQKVTRTSLSKFRVALVTMPFFPVTHPSIQIGLLHSHAEKAGFHVDSFHLNLDFAARMTLKSYDILSNHRGRMTSEWFFAGAAFGKTTTFEEYFDAFPEEAQYLRRSRVTQSYLKRVRSKAIPEFLEHCMKNIRWGKYSLIGFTSIFQQNVASLALASRIKKAYPEVKIIFGGSNMEGEMGIEYLRAFPFLDYVALGEGDKLFPELLRSLELNKSVTHIPGLAHRSNGTFYVNETAAPINDMDSLPVPNYDEYFKRADKLKLELSSMQICLPLETSRGCWWGEKHHCTFCGLNGSNMKFRSKSIQHVLNEIGELSNKYGYNFFATTDNILDLGYLKELFSKIEQLPRNYRFSWEIKSNLTREQIRHLYLGGMRALQPGIESLSTHVLQLMRKGCNMLQNLVALKWCRYYEILTSWNLLYGFPGELEQDFRNELKIVKLISHLQPPFDCSRIWLERYAPYYFDRANFPIRTIIPDPSYGYAYPEEVSLEKIAYFFEYEMENTLPDAIHYETKAWVRNWKKRWEEGVGDFLTFVNHNGKLIIDDRRRLLKSEGHRLGKYQFPSPSGAIYEFCTDSYRTARQITEELKKQDDGYDENSVQSILETLCQSGFMVSDEGKYLGLALPEPANFEPVRSTIL